MAGFEPGSAAQVAAIGPEAFARIAALLRRDAGIALEPRKAALVQGRLAKRVRALGLAGFDAYCDLLEADPGGEERRRMLNLLTTNVTRFFREPHHFDELREETLPPLLAAARAGGRIRIWSAGCSSGEEPWSIGLVLLGLEPEAARFDIRILATDIDTEVLAVARRGRYPAEALAPAPKALVRRHFAASDTAEGPALEVSPELRALVAFRPLNLLGTWPFAGPFDAIFCRNVIIYFDAETREKLIGRYAGALLPGGRLFLGHSERVPDTLSRLLLRGGVTSYVRA